MPALIQATPETDGTRYIVTGRSLDEVQSAIFDIIDAVPCRATFDNPRHDGIAHWYAHGFVRPNHAR